MRNVKIDLASFVFPSMAEKLSLSRLHWRSAKQDLFFPGSFTLHQIPGFCRRLQPTGSYANWLAPVKFKGSHRREIDPLAFKEAPTVFISEAFAALSQVLQFEAPIDSCLSWDPDVNYSQWGPPTFRRIRLRRASCLGKNLHRNPAGDYFFEFAPPPCSPRPLLTCLDPEFRIQST